jgi:hypothetical protein
MKVVACKPSTKAGRVIMKPSMPVSAKKQMLQDTKDLAEKLKGKILRMTKSLSNAEVMTAAPSAKSDGSEETDKND